MAIGLRALPLLLLASGALASGGTPPEIRPRIANGVATTASPEVAMIFTADGGTCTATLVGCRTLLTAAHCLCSADGRGAPCADGTSAEDPRDLLAFLPHVGLLGIEGVRVAPNYQFGLAGDLAVLDLISPVRGVRPRRINETARPPLGTPATILGFGVTSEGGADAGILRAGLVATESCNGLVPDATHVCWTFAAPVGPPGADSNTCSGDSGGPLLAELGAGLALVGVHSGGSLSNCEAPPSPSFDADVFVERTWIRSQAGVDLDETACGEGPQVGDAAVSVAAFSGSASQTEIVHAFPVPAGVRRLRATLNGVDDPGSDLDLYVQLGAPPSPASFDCASTFTGSFEWCELADPAPGSGFLMVRRALGTTRSYQARVTMLPEDPPPPPLRASGVLAAGFSSHELVQVDAGGGRRAVVSSALRGGGPDFAGPEGLALDAADGAVVVANALGRNLLRVDRATGARTLLSGCTDASCTSLRGAGPAFLGPRFVARGTDGAWLVADRSAPGTWALVRVDPESGDRAVVSGCSDASCTAVVGGGPAIGRLFGLAVEATGTVVVADGQAVHRIDPANGNRTILSGCADPSCSVVVGDGPAFGEPVDIALAPDGGLLVSYRREGAAFGAIRRIDPATGARTLVSGCEDVACSAQRGAGPSFVDLFGLAAHASGALLHASDSVRDAVLRVDVATGDRALLSGCGDDGCTVAAGAGPRLGEPVDLLVVPEAARGLGRAVAAGALAALPRRRWRRRGGGVGCGGRR
jgi:hypothetical protein